MKEGVWGGNGESPPCQQILKRREKNGSLTHTGAYIVGDNRGQHSIWGQDDVEE